MPTTVAGFGTQTLSSTDQAALALVPGTNFNVPLSIYAAGTAYSLTNAQAALTFGTTSPSLTLTGAAGLVFLLFARANLKYNAATFAANQTATLKLRRTNNTAADLTGATSTATLRILTTLTDGAGVIVLPPTIYTTAGTNDAVSIFGAVSTAPAAGSVDVTESEIVAVRLY